ncbi:CotH kinase family protein [Desulfococcaceae bacterium HSG7]|nr:CotH kinase family protein [Desulfococcaceae bacterium HSG7]
MYSHKTTAELPRFYLFVPGVNLKRLTSDLPLSARNYEEGKLKFRQREYDVKVRLRGDGPAHWALPKKSWRVKLRRGETIDGKYRRLNFINPKSFSMMQNLISYQLGSEFGLPAPNSFPCALYLNGKYQGVFMFTEQVDEYFLRNRGLPRGDIFYGEGDGISWLRADQWDHHLARYRKPEHGVRQFQSLFDTSAVDASPKDIFRDLPVILDLDNYIDYMALHMVSGTNQPKLLHNQKMYLNPTTLQIENIVWDFFAHRYPLARIFESPLTPIANKFFLISSWVEAKNRRVNEFLHGPAHVKKQTDFIDQITDRMRKAVRMDMAKISAGRMSAGLRKKLWRLRQGYSNDVWEKSIKDIKGFIKRRDTVMRSMLADARISLFLEKAANKGTFILRADSYGFTGARLNRVVFSVESPDQETLSIYRDRNRNGCIDLGDKRILSGKIEQGRWLVDLNDTLLSGRAKWPLPKNAKKADKYAIRHSPEELKKRLAKRDIKFLPYTPSVLSYPYLVDIPCTGKLRLLSADAVNNITGERIEVGINKHLKLRSYGHRHVKIVAPEGLKTLSLHPWEAPKKPLPRKTVEKIWSGKVSVRENVVVPAGETLIIRPGTQIMMAQGCSLKVIGRLDAKGTKEFPILFEKADREEWGAIIMQGEPQAHASVRMSNVWIQGGSGQKIRAAGVLCGVYADVELDGCVFTDLPGKRNDGINLSSSNLRATSCVFKNIGSDAIDLDYSRGEIRGCLFLSSGQDAIDIGSCSPVIRDNIILNAASGVSCGEGAGPLIFNNYIARCKVAVGAKSEAIPIVVNCALDKNRTGFLTKVAPKKNGRTGWIEVHNTVIKRSPTVQKAPGGRVTFANSFRASSGGTIPLDVVDESDITEITFENGAYQALPSEILAFRGSGYITRAMTGEGQQVRVHSGLLRAIRIALPTFCHENFGL